mgnify:FL=1
MAMIETLKQALDTEEKRRAQSYWLPASGGTEQPFTTKTGHRVQYMYQPLTGKHAYLDLDSDLFIADEALASYGLGA